MVLQTIKVMMGTLTVLYVIGDPDICNLYYRQRDVELFISILPSTEITKETHLIHMGELQ